MMEQSQLNEIKQQLWDYYKKMNEYAMSLAEEGISIDLFTGVAQKILYAPVGLRDELTFIRDEIEFWMTYERGMLPV